MKSPFDAYIFDLDGTLLDTLPDLVLLTNMALDQVGLPSRTEAEIRSYVGNGIKALMLQAVPVGTDDKTAALAIDLWMDLYPVYGTGLTRPYEGIDQMLDLLKSQGKKLAVLSNKFDAGTKHLIEQFFPNIFDVVYGVGKGIPRKPDPVGLMRVIKELGCSVEDALYVGDSPGDMITARRAGCADLCVSWGYHAKDDLIGQGVSHIIDNPAEISDWVLAKDE